MGPNGREGANREGANRARAGAGAVGCGLWAGLVVGLICSLNIYNESFH